MRMSCVILQRRLPLRSGAEAFLSGASVVVFFVISSFISSCIGSCCVAMAKPAFRTYTYLSKEKSSSGATKKPMGEAYPERGNTSRRNSSTEVPRKEADPEEPEENVRTKNGLADEKREFRL